MKIALGLCYYEDLQGIKRLFDSLEKTNASPYRIFAIDGKYKQFSETENMLSSSEVHKYLEQFPKVVNYTEWKTFPTEIEKRNKYLELCQDDIDFLIVVDSDEYLQGDWDLFVTNLEKLKEPLLTHNDPQTRHIHYMKMEDCHYPQTSSLRYANRPRLFYKPNEIQYDGCHYTWSHRATGLPLQYPKTDVISGIEIVHDNTHRPKEYEQNMTEYQKYQKTAETNELIYTVAIKKKPVFFKNMKPLIFVISPRDIPEFQQAADKIQKYDKYWVKYFWPAPYAYRNARDFFLQNKEYTHLIMLPDDLIATEYDIDTLLAHIQKNPQIKIISGHCNLDSEKKKDYTNVCLLPVSDDRKNRHYAWITFDEFNIWSQFNKDENGLVKVKFSGYPLMVIDREVVEKIQFRNDLEPDGIHPRGCCLDVTFCADALRAGYDIYVDPAIRLKHLKLSDGKYAHMGSRKKQPYTKLEKSIMAVI